MHVRFRHVHVRVHEVCACMQVVDTCTYVRTHVHEVRPVKYVRTYVCAGIFMVDMTSSMCIRLSFIKVGYTIWILLGGKTLGVHLYFNLRVAAKNIQGRPPPERIHVYRHVRTYVHVMKS